MPATLIHLFLRFSFSFFFPPSQEGQGKLARVFRKYVLTKKKKKFLYSVILLNWNCGPHHIQKKAPLEEIILIEIDNQCPEDAKETIHKTVELESPEQNKQSALSLLMGNSEDRLLLLIEATGNHKTYKQRCIPAER